MARLGRSVRSVAPVSTRERIRSLWIGIFGCEHVTPRDDLDVFTFADSSRIGVYFVDDALALSAECQRDGGTWIEIVVADPRAMEATLTAAGVEPLPYHDAEHRYFQAPGGQVFRLA